MLPCSSSKFSSICLLHDALYERVTESEGGGGEGVGDGGVDPRVVSAGVGVAGRREVEAGHGVRPQHEGQPLVVSYVLQQAAQSRDKEIE